MCSDESRNIPDAFLRNIDQKQPGMKKFASPALVRADENWRIATLAKRIASITAPHNPPHPRR